MVMERTTKKYSSPAEARKKSKWRWPRNHCNNVEYLSSRKMDAKAPGDASRATTTPKPKLISSLRSSSSEAKRRLTK